MSWFNKVTYELVQYGRELSKYTDSTDRGLPGSSELNKYQLKRDFMSP